MSIYDIFYRGARFKHNVTGNRIIVEAIPDPSTNVMVYDTGTCRRRNVSAEEIAEHYEPDGYGAVSTRKRQTYVRAGRLHTNDIVVPGPNGRGHKLVVNVLNTIPASTEVTVRYDDGTEEELWVGEMVEVANP